MENTEKQKLERKLKKLKAKHDKLQLDIYHGGNGTGILEICAEMVKIQELLTNK